MLATLPATNLTAVETDPRWEHVNSRADLVNTRDIQALVGETYLNNVSRLVKRAGFPAPLIDDGYCRYWLTAEVNDYLD